MILMMGSEFMPPLDEGSLLFMPVTMPSASITEVNRIMQVQDAIIMSRTRSGEGARQGREGGDVDRSGAREHDRVHHSAEAKGPVEAWRSRRTTSSAELDAKLQIPGVRNGWTQPIINRINMLSTGVRTDLGVKIFGRNLDTLEALAIGPSRSCAESPARQTSTRNGRREGMFLDIDIDREAVARYGINIGDVQDIIETAIGGREHRNRDRRAAAFPHPGQVWPGMEGHPEALRNLLVPVNVRGRAGPSAMAAQPSFGAGVSGQGGMSGSGSRWEVQCGARPDQPPHPSDRAPSPLRARVSSRSYLPLGATGEESKWCQGRR